MRMAAPTCWTVDLAQQLPDDGKRDEVAYGEPLVTPAPRFDHQLLVGRLVVALAGRDRAVFAVSLVMTKTTDWRAIVASALDWKQAHVTLEEAVAALPRELRGRRPTGFPHSVWELLEHIRITQRDLLDFMVAETYHEAEWPEAYWPQSPEPASDAAWDECLATIARDRAALARFTTETDIDLTTKIPRGTGQTFLRTVLVAVDHTAYHAGQIVAVRRLLGAWPAGG